MCKKMTTIWACGNQEEKDPTTKFKTAKANDKSFCTVETKEPGEYVKCRYKTGVFRCPDCYPPRRREEKEENASGGNNNFTGGGGGDGDEASSSKKAVKAG